MGFDNRTNYRFYLNDENDITMKMKRDSRLRVRKLLRNKNEFSEIKADLNMKSTLLQNYIPIMQEITVILNFTHLL